eukprot:5092955-Prymnesium_polylepis.1
MRRSPAVRHGRSDVAGLTRSGYVATPEREVLTFTCQTVGGKVVQSFSLHDLCHLYMSSKELNQECKVLVDHLDAPQRKIICDLTPPFPTKRALFKAFAHTSPVWLFNFIDLVLFQVKDKRSRFPSICNGTHRLAKRKANIRIKATATDWHPEYSYTKNLRMRSPTQNGRRRSRIPMQNDTLSMIRRGVGPHTHALYSLIPGGDAPMQTLSKTLGR